MAFRFKYGDRPLEGYVIHRGIGAGGCGEVYYAVSDSGKEVALKYLKENPQVELRGVSHCMNLKSPHLVTIFDIKQNAEGEYFIIMEYVAGPSLRDLLVAEPDGVGMQKAVFFLREIVKGLSYLHDRGIVHRDLKPGNIMYEDGYVKIADYGLSKFMSVSRHSAQTVSVGTVHYMAPEVGSGNYHKGIDVYALGVILYEMLLGRVPFEGASMGEVLMKHLTEQPEVDDLPEPFGGVIRKALAKDPNERYQTADEMIAEIFGVEDIKQSLVGFEPKSLTQLAEKAAGMAARAGAGAKSPMPSPNLPPPPPPAVPRSREPAGQAGERIAGVRLTTPVTPRQRGMRTVMGIMIALAIALIAAILPSRGDEETIVGSVLMICGMSMGVLVSRRFFADLLSDDPPKWVQQLLMIACAAPLMLIGALVASEGGMHGRAFGVMLALMATLAIADWAGRALAGAKGDLQLRSAFTAGLCALILAAVFTEGSDHCIWISASAAAAASLIVQALSFLIVGLRERILADGPQTTHHSSRFHEAIKEKAKAVSSHLHGDKRPHTPPPIPEHVDMPDADPPLAIPVDREVPSAQTASCWPLPPERHPVTRVLAGLLALACMGAMLANIFFLAFVDHIPKDEFVGHIVLAALCFGLLIDSARRTRRRKAPTFWREWVRPFLVVAAMMGLAASITSLVVFNLEAEELVGVLTGLIMSFICLVVLLAAGGRRHVKLPGIHKSESRTNRLLVGVLTGLIISFICLVVLLAAGGRRHVNLPGTYIEPSGVRIVADG